MFGQKKKLFLKSLREGKKMFIKEDLSFLNLSKINIEDLVFVDCDLSHILLARSKLRNIEFKGCDLQGSSFEISSLIGVNFTQCNMVSCCLEESSLDRCGFYGVSSNMIILRDSEIKNTLFKDSDLGDAVFSSSLFRDSEITRSNLEGVDFTYADICGLRIMDCKLKKSNFTAVTSLSDNSRSFFKAHGAKVDGNMERYLSYVILSALILIMAYGSREFFNRYVKTSSDTHNIQPDSPNIYSDSPEIYVIKKLSYEGYKDYVEKNNFSENLIKNGDFSSGLDWWMSSDRYYRTKGVIKIDSSEFHSEPVCVRAVTKTTTRIHSSSKNKDFSEGHPYVNYTEIKGYKELAFSFWYKLNPVNAYVVNVMDGSHSMLSVVDVPCTNTQWNNFSAIIELPQDRPVGFEVEITFGQGETLVDDIELRGKN